MREELQKVREALENAIVWISLRDTSRCKTEREAARAMHILDKLLAEPQHVSDTNVVDIQPMGKGDRATLVEGMGDVLYSDAEMELQDWRAAGGDKHYYPVITNEKALAQAALAHIEANYHLVKKEK